MKDDRRDRDRRERRDSDGWQGMGRGWAGDGWGSSNKHRTTELVGGSNMAFIFHFIYGIYIYMGCHPSH